MEIRPKDGKSRPTYTFNCSIPYCSNKIKSRSDYLEKHSGLCRVHTMRKEPFQSIYNSMLYSNKRLTNTLSFQEFLSFTKINSCHYCLTKIKWEPYETVNCKFITKAYFLDRKDNSLGYSKDNCVVCCRRCNVAKSNTYSYEEWYNMNSWLRSKHDKSKP